MQMMTYMIRPAASLTRGRCLPKRHLHQRATPSAFTNHRAPPAAVSTTRLPRFQLCGEKDLFASATRRLAHAGPTRTFSACRVSAATAVPADAGEASVANLRILETATEPGTWAGDLLVIGISEEDLEVGDGPSYKEQIAAQLLELDEAFGGIIGELIEEGEFKGKLESSHCARLGGIIKRVAIVGMGRYSDSVSLQARYAGLGKAVARLSKEHKAKSAAVTVIGGGELLSTSRAAFARAACLATYEDCRWKSDAKASKLESLQLLTKSEDGEGIAEGVALANGAILTMQLVSAPPNVATPSFLAQAAADIAAKFPDVMSLKVLEKEECEALRMGAYLGVAEASEEPPKFIHLTYTPTGGASKKLGIVGKGLTFDSGGYNLKAGAGSMIEMMKFDMGGSGATLGAARSIAELAPAGVEVHFIVASCENMVAGKGLRPGDILVASNGKTIEVNNTDAEGRLTLADALLYAQDQGVTKVVDIATLTGACMVALGPSIAGMFTPSDELAAALDEASSASGEKLWRMPMEASYWDQMKSPIADMKNTGGRMGGAITAALFLEKYVSEDLQWAHLDIAGPVWDEKAGAATGFGATTLTQWVVNEGTD